MMIDLRDAWKGASASARRIDGKDRPPRARPPIRKNVRRGIPSQKRKDRPNNRSIAYPSKDPSVPRWAGDHMSDVLSVGAGFVNTFRIGRAVRGSAARPVTGE